MHAFSARVSTQSPHAAAAPHATTSARIESAVARSARTSGRGAVRGPAPPAAGATGSGTTAKGAKKAPPAINIIPKNGIWPNVRRQTRCRRRRPMAAARVPDAAAVCRSTAAAGAACCSPTRRHCRHPLRLRAAPVTSAVASCRRPPAHRPPRSPPQTRNKNDGRTRHERRASRR